MTKKRFDGARVCHFCLICRTTARDPRCPEGTTKETCKKIPIGGKPNTLEITIKENE